MNIHKAQFKEDDIRPQVYKEKMEEAKQADILNLAGQKKDFVRVDCPACGSSDSAPAFEKYSFQFSCCRECGTVFMNPRATPEILDKFYSQSLLYDIWNKYVFPASEDVRRNKIFRGRVEKILDICRKFDIKTGCLVEVGAGFGIFCEEIISTKQFDKVIAIEPGEKLAESCRSRGIETIEKSIDAIDSLPLRPDVVASFEVIEHLFSPYDFLTNCKRLMAPQSIIALTCPNYKGFAILELGIEAESIDHEHINLFNPDSLQVLLKRCGFDVLECFTPGEIDADIVRNKILQGKHKVSDDSFLKTVLIDRWDELGSKFQTYLRDNNLSSHMWLVAKNK